MLRSTKARAMAVVDYDEPLREIDLTLPPLGEDDVVVKVSYCGVCATDAKIAGGTLGFSRDLPLPHVPGHEITGTVVDAGPRASALVGVRVVVYDYQGCGACPSCRDGHETTCTDLRRRVGFTSHGGFAEAIVVPAGLVVPLPDAVDDLSAAALSCAISTAYRAVVTRARTRPGDQVLVCGAGGVGIHAAQIAHAAGASVVVTEPSARAREAAEGLGLTVLDPSRDEEAIGSSGQRFDKVIETSGVPGVVPGLVKVVGPRGRIVLVGYQHGRSSDLDAEACVLNEIELVGSRYATRSDLVHAVDLLARGAVRAVVTEAYPLERANEALDAVRRGAAVGRLAVRLS